MWFVVAAASIALGSSLVMALTGDAVQSSFAQYLLTVPIPFLVAGAVLLRSRPDHPAGPLLIVVTAAGIAVSALLESLLTRRIPISGIERWMSWALVGEALISTVSISCLAVLIGLFPTCRPETRPERVFARSVWWAPAPMLIALLANENVLVEEMGFGGFPPFPNPIHVDALGWLGPATRSMRYILYSVTVVAIAFLFRRYRRAAMDVRIQIRWVLFGGGAAIAIGVVPFFLSPLYGTGSPVHGSLMAIASLALLLIPASVVVGVVQPSWIDADAVIRKSFIYGALSLGIFVIYAAIASGLGMAAGARLPVEVAIVVTAVLAFAFQPARRRLQAIADRWVFGERPTPLEAITGLDRGDHVDGSVEEVGVRLAELARSIVRLRWVEVSIGTDIRASAGSAGKDPVLTLPIERHGERLGTIRCGPPQSGTLADEDVELIRALVGQAALLVSNVRLAGRIVGAQEAERRRIERHIHDGAQQELVALVAKLGLARETLKRGELDDSVLLDLKHDAQAILRDLRDLAQGIHPSVLTDGGLVEAVEDRCSRLPIEVTVSADPDVRVTRFGDDVEGAAYFFVAEAVANILKHASASRASIGIRRANGDLELTVSDDGVGFDPAAIRQNGLVGLSDRFSALSGSVSIEAAPGTGAVLRARVPVTLGS